LASIFLSYARENRSYAEKLAKTLETVGHNVWWDQHIDSGSEFAGEIEAALGRADVVLVAWSEAAGQSPWVRDEAAVGRDTGRLLPILIDGSLAPIGFRQYQALDLTGWKGGKNDPRTVELIRAVERRLKTKGKVLPAHRGKTAAAPVRPPRNRLWAATAALILLVVAVGGALWIRNVTNSSGEPLKPTIALLPFTSASPDAGLRQVASQTRDFIAHTFSQSGVPLRMMSVAPTTGQSPVDFLISGDVSNKGDNVLVTVRLDEAAHGVTVYSRQFEASRDEVLGLPERIGAQMAGNLTWSSPMRILDRRHPLAPDVLTDLLNGDFSSDILEEYQTAKRTVAKAPDSSATQLRLAFDTAFVLSELPSTERAAAVSEARRAADRAIELDPGFGDSYAVWCLLHSDTLRAECEDRLRKGKRIDPDAPFLNTFLSHLLRDVGRFDEAMDLARMGHAHDIYVPTKIAWMLKAFETEGERSEAEDLYRQASAWWPDYKPMFFRNRLFGLVVRGDFEAISRLEQEVGATKLIPGYQPSGPLVAALKSKSIAAGRRACPDTDAYPLQIRCMIVLADLGDMDGAFAIAKKLYPSRIGATPAATEWIWMNEPDYGSGEIITSPAAASMRRDARFLQLADRFGLLAYWRTGRLPDFCKKRPEPVCKHLSRKQ